MRKIIFTSFLIFQFSLAIFAWEMPDPRLTPGRVDNNLTKDILCSPDFSTSRVRKVTTTMHKQVFAAYMIPWSDHRKYEDDHLVSLELGGSNDNSNRWPQPIKEARIKDVLENVLHKKVCADEMSLEDAQGEIAIDWRKSYQENIGPLPRIPK